MEEGGGWLVRLQNYDRKDIGDRDDERDKS